MVSLFPTCLGDAVSPAAVRDAEAVLRAAGADPQRPRGATCCGQPAWNSGFTRDARRVARTTLRALEGGGDVVVPAGSCAAMMRLHWPQLFEGAERERARAVAARVYELSQYLVDVLGVTAIGTPTDRTVAYHDSCHMLRELRIAEQPRVLLRSVANAGRAAAIATVAAASAAPSACATPRCRPRWPTTSSRRPERPGIDLIASADPGCALQLGGRASRTGAPRAGRAPRDRARGGAVSTFTTRARERLADTDLRRRSRR